MERTINKSLLPNILEALLESIWNLMPLYPCGLSRETGLVEK